MAYVKVDCGMLNSTIWYDTDARIVFLTALLMAEPKDFDAPIPQLEVRSLTETGWSAPPGWYGYVPAAGPAIAIRSGIDMEAGITALERLCSPEATSRSQDFEGRRMIRCDGGYLVLNYQKYRDKDHTTADRSRRYRERKRLQASEQVSDEADSHAVTLRNHGVTNRSVTQAEAEAEAEAEETPPTSVSRRARKRATPLSEDWTPKDFIESERPELNRMRNWAKAKAIVRADWEATWQNWKTNPNYNHVTAPTPAPPPRIQPYLWPDGTRRATPPPKV